MQRSRQPALPPVLKALVVLYSSVSTPRLLPHLPQGRSILRPLTPWL